jgi:hypothetical protein
MSQLNDRVRQLLMKSDLARLLPERAQSLMTPSSPQSKDLSDGAKHARRSPARTAA